MKQIIMITDGKPSALTQPDGRISKNAFGLDPFILPEPFAAVAACRTTGLILTPLRLARTSDLWRFVPAEPRLHQGKD